jgi:hypothetical protein
VAVRVGTLLGEIARRGTAILLVEQIPRFTCKDDGKDLPATIAGRRFPVA